MCCGYLAKAKWNNLEDLKLCYDYLIKKTTISGARVVVKAKWDNLQNIALRTHLIIQANLIREKGCDYLAKAKWANLK